MGRPPVLVVDGKKKCSRCKAVRDIQDFGISRSAACGYTSHCLDCSKELWYVRTYGIEPGQKEKLIELQRGLCALCEQPLPESTRRVHLDHCNRWLLPGYERLPAHLKDSPRINNYLSHVTLNLLEA